MARELELDGGGEGFVFYEGVWIVADSLEERGGAQTALCECDHFIRSILQRMVVKERIGKRRGKRSLGEMAQKFEVNFGS